MQTKQHAGAQVKTIGEGTARVAFAQLHVVDHDGDYTLSGAFQPGQKVKVCQTGHAHGALPAGAGTIVGEEPGPDDTMWAVADLKLFLNTQAGRETYETIKALHDAGHTQEWSYGYDVLDAGPIHVDGKHANALKRLSVYEISPVLRGAGIGTHTLDVKSADKHAVYLPITDQQLEEISQEVVRNMTKSADAKTCSECGQALPKAADEDAAGDQVEVCPDCEQPMDECECEKAAAADGAKGSAADLYLAFLALKARGMQQRV